MGNHRGVAVIARAFGNTGLMVSPLGIGCVKWGRNQGVKYGSFDLPSDAVIEQLLDLAMTHGVNVLDTAPAYGISEERIGNLLGGVSGRREKFCIFTKTGEIFSDGKSSYDFTAEHTRASVEQSLRRLRTDCLDGVMVHCPADDLGTLRDTPVLETLQALKQQGKVRTVGASIMTIDGGMYAVERCDAVMVAFNYGFDQHVPVIEAAAKRGRGILLKKVFYSGALPPAAQAGGGIEVSTPAEVCVHAALRLPGNPVVVTGTMSASHLRQNIDAVRSFSSLERV